MSIEREIGKGLSFIDNTVRDITRRALSQGSVTNFEIFLTTPIDNYCLIDMADFQLQRHMLMNLAQKDNLIYLIGNSVSGISNKVSDETYDYNYSYTQDNNYLENFQRYDAKETTTRSGWRNDNIQNYVNHNQIYGETINVYPDDDDTGTGNFTESEKWDSYIPNRNPNSILKKTKDFFRDRKINTIISRFHTDAEKLDLYDNTESATSAYGLSHGRNLLTYDAERKGRSYNRNGYDDPYCRVWTHHHQYSQHRHRLIRPFTVESENGETAIKNQTLHKWKDFKNVKYIAQEGRKWLETITTKDEEFNEVDEKVVEREVPDKYEEWGWKDKGAQGWAMSVLDNETGLVNIAPKYLGGADKNVHPKDCMFSIENLAWQGYDPYSFERALSWEQRGPFGGRIMWFPPYGLRFNEDASVQWNEHSFIGRGENVYTYTNTSRSGTLEFMMVVDHPSILDYTTWYGKSQPEQLPKDTDVLRFFAGCDSGNSKDESSLLSYVKPTPLTDEYLKKDVPGPIPIKPDEPEQPTPTEPEVESPDEPIELSFYVFYPNNYSGYFDRGGDSKVDPISYLLCGNGSQWKCNINNVKQSEVLPISFKDLSTTNEQFLGKGYEMQDSRSDVKQQNTDNNFIIGTGPKKGYGKNSYIQNNDKRWYYRIDGEYVNGITYNATKNCFGQTLATSKSYQDERSYGLNWNVETVKTYMEETNNENLYSLAEVACALASDVNANVIKRNASLDEERINKLKEYFNKEGDYKVIEIKGIGYSNSHGSNSETSTNQQRNEFLAIERCSTVFEWFKSNYGEVTEGTKEHVDGKAVTKGENASGQTAKMWRSAKITLKIKKNKVQTQEELNTKNYAEMIFFYVYDKLSEEDKTKYKPNTYMCSSCLTKLFVTAEEFADLEKEKQLLYHVYFYELKKEDEEDEQVEIDDGTFQKFTGFTEAGTDPNGRQLYTNDNENDPTKKERKWIYNEEKQQMELYQKEYEKTKRSSYGWTSEYGKEMNQQEENNTLRYDQEYHFFKKLSERDPDVFNSLVDKLQYFDPAFHSMTPEGFMGRLNFLHQCTRQGDTRSASDKNGHTANNLAFGRPPFCVLRLGDFYYQKIVIKNINITYDPLVLDLNNEGVGVVPLIANVTISFNFIGGGDLSGPVRRLQNAMSENFYANSRLYNNRADRIERNKEWDTMKTTIDWDKSYYHSVKMSE